MDTETPIGLPRPISRLDVACTSCQANRTFVPMGHGTAFSVVKQSLMAEQARFLDASFRATWRAALCRGRVLHVEGHALSWPCPPPGGPCSVVAVFPVLADATAARPSIRLEPLPIAILKTYKGHALSWPCPPRGGPRSVVAVFSVLADATAARPSNLVAAAGRFRL